MTRKLESLLGKAGNVARQKQFANIAFRKLWTVRFRTLSDIHFTFIIILITYLYARFETTDFVQERALELETLNSENGHSITLQVEEVGKKLAKINPKKAPGPDKISDRCLKECNRESGPHRPLSLPAVGRHTHGAVLMEIILYCSHSKKASTIREQ